MFSHDFITLPKYTDKLYLLWHVSLIIRLLLCRRFNFVANVNFSFTRCMEIQITKSYKYEQLTNLAEESVGTKLSPFSRGHKSIFFVCMHMLYTCLCIHMLFTYYRITFIYCIVSIVQPIVADNK